MAGRTGSTRGRRRGRWTLAALVLLLLVAAGCQPVPHPDHVVVDGATTLSVRGLSGDGNYAVVSASAASDTVPGPGLWRIDRRTGEAVALPDGTALGRISHDGRRILLVDSNFATSLWNDGAIVEGLPSGAPMSRDLRYAIFVGILNPRLIRLEIATGIRTPFGPSGAAFRDPGISDDGRTAWYRTDTVEDGCRTSFVDIGTGTSTVHEMCDAIVNVSGTHLLAARDTVGAVSIWGSFIGGPTRLQVYASTNPGVVVAEAVAAPETVFADISIAADRPVVWAAEVRPTGNVTDPCGSPFTPPCTFSETTTALVVATPDSTKRLAVPDDLATSIDGQPRRTTITPGGRFLVHSSNDGLVYVHDRIGSRQETLVGEGGALGRPLVSDDGRIVVVGEGSVPWLVGSGWHEHLAEGEPAAAGAT